MSKTFVELEIEPSNHILNIFLSLKFKLPREVESSQERLKKENNGNASLYFCPPMNICTHTHTYIHTHLSSSLTLLYYTL